MFMFGDDSSAVRQQLLAIRRCHSLGKGCLITSIAEIPLWRLFALLLCVIEHRGCERIVLLRADWWLGILACAAGRYVRLCVGGYVEAEHFCVGEDLLWTRSVFRCRIVGIANRSLWGMLPWRHLSDYLSLSRCTFEHHQRLFDLFIKLFLTFPHFLKVPTAMRLPHCRARLCLQSYKLSGLRFFCLVNVARRLLPERSCLGSLALLKRL